MNEQRRKRSVRPAVIFTVALVVVASILAGCDSTTESPGGPSGTGATSVQVTAVPANVRTAVERTLKAADVKFDDASIMVVYGLSKNRAVATGVLQGHPGLGEVAPGKDTDFVGYGEIDLTLLNGKWVITGSK